MTALILSDMDFIKAIFFINVGSDFPEWQFTDFFFLFLVDVIFSWTTFS